VVEIDYPGVYVEEAAYGVSTIAGVATSTAGFVGEAASGEHCAAVRVKSVADFERTLPGSGRGSELGVAVSQFFAGGGSEAWVAGVPRGTPLSEGLQRLDAADTLNLLCLPGETDVRVWRAALEYAGRRRAFVLIDPPGADLDRTVALAESLAASGSANGAIYFPPIQVDDPVTGGLRTCPPSGAVAGLYARHDRALGVWKAPGGEHAVLPGVVAPEVELGEAAISELKAAAVNAIRRFPTGGIRVWGSRTLQGGEQSTSDWTYVPVRRLALFIEESLSRGTRWAVFEPNDEPLWATLRLQCAVFLDALFRAGALQGSTADKAYFVRCGLDTMSQNDLDNGRLRLVVGIAPIKPAEFVHIAIGQWLSRVCTEALDATGSPCERLRLQHHPVAAEGVFLQVPDDGAWTTWSEVADFHDAGPRDRVYTLDRDAGELVFGDGEHGAIPPAGSENIRATYRYGGGRGHPSTAESGA
jgi:phage tail sheath protein FI